MAVTLVLAAALAGLLVGSFLNVVIWRLPRGESLVRPRSHCPSCGSPLRVRDTVPVASWLLLRGRCRHCAVPISPRYPLVELLTAGVFAALAARFAFSDASAWALPAYLYLGAVGVALALIDVDSHRLPNALTLPSYGVGAGLLGVATLGTGGGLGPVARAALGMAALYAVYFALLLAYPGGMGFGDVKLAGVLGLYTGWLGWGTWVVGLFAAFLFGGLVAVALLVAGRAGRRSALPFGPFMLLGALVAVTVGEPLMTAYLRLGTG